MGGLCWSDAVQMANERAPGTAHHLPAWKCPGRPWTESPGVLSPFHNRRRLAARRNYRTAPSTELRPCANLALPLRPVPEFAMPGRRRGLPVSHCLKRLTNTLSYLAKAACRNTSPGQALPLLDRRNICPFAGSPLPGLACVASRASLQPFVAPVPDCARDRQRHSPRG